jgi:hypothetical protein
MKRFNNQLENMLYLIYRWISPIFDPIYFTKGIFNYPWYLRDLFNYGRSPGAEQIKLIDTYPVIYDRTATNHIDFHYWYQAAWAFNRIYQSRTDHHVDVGSQIDLIGPLLSITNVTFIDLRPIEAVWSHLESRKGSILSMPYDNNSIKSLSCLHVAEHIGLGRYGDPIDPVGTKKAAVELSRVLAPGVNLFFSLPIGKPRLCFNAHRIHSTKQILSYFKDLRLIELSGVCDDRRFYENVSPKKIDACDYGCGMFWFTKNNTLRT